MSDPIAHSSTARKGNVETASLCRRPLMQPFRVVSVDAAVGGLRQRAGSRGQQMDGRRQTMHRLIEGAGAGQRRQVLLQARLQLQQMMFALLQAAQRRHLRRQAFADARQRRLLIVPILTHHARQRPQLLEQPRALLKCLFFQRSQQLRMRLQRAFERHLQSAGHLFLLPRVALARPPLILGQRLRPHIGLPFDELPGSIEQHLRILTECLDERPAIAGDALEAMGQLPLDLAIDAFEDVLLLAFDEEATEHRYHGQAEGQRGGVEGVG